MSDDASITLDGPDAYLLEEEEKVKQSVILNNKLRQVIESRNKPDTAKMVETSEFINISPYKRRISVGNDDFSKRRVNSNGERTDVCKFDFLGCPNDKERMKLPWERIPNYLCIAPGIDLFFVHLNNEIVQLVKWLELTGPEHMLRTRALARITLISHSLWPGSKVQPFGSYYTGLSLPTGDLDVCILNVPGNPKRRLRELASLLKEWKLCIGIELILTARVPIIKYVDSEACISVDISLNQESSIDTTRHISNCLNKFCVLRPLLIIIKLFLRQRGLDETYLGGLGSYSQFCLVLSFLQQHSSSYSNVLFRSTTLGHLLFDFLELFGVIFNYNGTGIRSKGGGEYFCRLSYISKSDSVLSLESPLSPYIDVGRGAFKYNDIKESFRLAFLDLVESRGKFYSICLGHDKIDSRDPQRFSIISSIISTDDELFQCRTRPVDNSQLPISAVRSPPVISREILKKTKLELEAFRE